MGKRSSRIWQLNAGCTTSVDRSNAALVWSSCRREGIDHVVPLSLGWGFFGILFDVLLEVRRSFTLQLMPIFWSGCLMPSGGGFRAPPPSCMAPDR